MALQYTVQHGFFGSDGTYYTRDNAEDIRSLSRKERDHLIELGHITEYDDRRGVPDAPATSGETE